MKAPAPKELPPLCHYCGQPAPLGYFCSDQCAANLGTIAAAHGYSTKTYQDADRRRRLKGDDK